MVSERKFSLAPGWRTTAVACAVIFSALIALFYPTVQSMTDTWTRSETYTHGFIILPISLWLIWQKKAHLVAFTPQPTPGLLVLLAGSLMIWSLARLTGVLVVEQFAFIAVLVTALTSLLGWQVSKFLAFPLLFLFFAVPMGEDLVPPMMEYTATFTVAALKLTGIPVYREGLWFSLPSGNWSVVEACSGVRYLIASVTLGVMYAYITYHTLWKRLLFIVLSAVVPIVANGLRAYMIVMIGHFSEMKYATGVDHLIYGWVFFGVVMFILFWLGSYWQEEQEPPRFVAPPRVMSEKSVGIRISLITSIALVVAVSTVWATHQAATVEATMAGELVAPPNAGRWRLVEEPVAWEMAHQPTAHKIEARYSDGESQAQLHVVLYPQQHHGNEAINSENKVSADLIKKTDLGGRELAYGKETFRVNRSKVLLSVDDSLQEHLVWQWYRVAGRNLTNRYEGKAWEALARIYPGRADGAWIALTTPLGAGDKEAAERRLSQFAGQIAPLIDKGIESALGVAN